MSHFFKFLLAGVLFSPCYAQNPWTLQQCVDHALKNNIQVKQSILSSEVSRERMKQSVASLLPSLNGSASHTYNYGRSVDPFTYEFTTERIQSNNFSINTNLTLFNGFQLQNTVRQSQYDYMASRYDTDKMRNDIAMAVVNGYLQVLFAEDLVQSSSLLVDASRQQMTRTRRMVEVGSLPKGSLLDVESQVASEELKLVNAQNQLTMAYLNLVQLLDLDSIEGFRIERPAIILPDENILNIPAEAVYQTALTLQPEIKSSEFKLKSAEKALSIARGAYSPRLSIFGSLSTGYSDGRKRFTGYNITGYNTDTIGYTPSAEPVISIAPTYETLYESTPFNDQIDENFNKAVGLNLSIPLFNAWQVRTSVARSRVGVESARLNDELARDQLRKTIQQAHADAVAALNKLKATEKAAVSTRESYRYIEQRFNVGLISSIEYTNARNNLSRAESDLLQARYDYVFRVKVLDFYQGKPLTF